MAGRDVAGQIGKLWTRCLCNDRDLILGDSVVSSSYSHFDGKRAGLHVPPPPLVLAL
jgi:hypothetical protein